MTAKPKRLVLSVRFFQGQEAARSAPNGHEWGVVFDGSVLVRFDTKALAIAEARSRGKAYAKSGGLAQVRVFGKNGRIQTEWTYPRSSDPRRSRG